MKSGQRALARKLIEQVSKNSMIHSSFIKYFYKQVSFGIFTIPATLSIKVPRSFQYCNVGFSKLVLRNANLVNKNLAKEMFRELSEKAFENVKRVQLERYNKCSKPEDRERIETDPLNIMYKAVANTKPLLQLSPIKRGGVTYRVPVPITEKRSNFLAMKWLIEAANDKERTVHFPEKLAWELLDAAKNQGRVVKKKQDLHRQCEANRAYAHYRWS
ncbi:hypothetical protein PR048_004929 [Dryococelus australis]|uniref:Small ribosomal subunit protein uS7 domain-containing protein n=1 Tax=Dryococelus australis TaxID=614101 RepID=A0ABQ9I6T7_9NEOP|nr:hypothetical protein PR048_004929 [Dryococelus australis]